MQYSSQNNIVKAYYLIFRGARMNRMQEGMSYNETLKITEFVDIFANYYQILTKVNV